ncbi:MAG: COX15/CtaA family protein [Bacteroidetes bacterium]|nr:COX15/CtaA family protein [Bacteroidota bacterium]
MENQQNNPIIIWLLTGCLLIFLMVIIGGITRLTNSGLSMVDWNPIMGFIPPMSDLSWNEAFDKYKQYPEYQLVNYHFTLDEFKSIFFWEYFHRLIGRVIGVVFLLPFIYFLIRKQLSKKLILQCLILFGMGGLQGFIGWWMVKSGLVKDPDVSHFRLAIHLITAFLTFAYTFWVALGLMYEDKKTIDFKSLTVILYFIFGVTVLQIIYGAFVAGLNAGFVMNTFPKMGDQWISDSVTALSPTWLNFVEGIGGVQFIHRYLAYLVVGLIIYFVVRSRKYELSVRQKKSTNILLYAVLFQFLLGVFTLILSVPVWLGVLHQLGAFLLLTAIVFSMHAYKKS